MLLHTSTGMMGTGNMFQVLLLHGPIKLYMDWTYHTHTYYYGLKGEKQKYPNSRE